MSFLAVFAYTRWWCLSAKNNKKNIFNVANSWKLLLFKWVTNCCFFEESEQGKNFLFRKNDHSSLNSPMYIFCHDIIADVTFAVKT